MKKKLIQITPKQFVLSALPLFVIGSYVFWSFNAIVGQLLQKVISGQTEALVEKVEYEVRASFEPPANALNTLVSAIEKSENRSQSSIYALVKSTGEMYPQAAAFYFSTAESVAGNGYLAMSDDWQAPRGWSQLDRPWYTGAVKAAGQMYASDMYQNARFGAVCISFSRAVYDERRNLIGVAGFDIPLDELSKATDSLRISNNGYINVLDAKGVFLTNKDTSFIMTKNYFDLTSLDTRKYPASVYLDGKAKCFTQGKSFFAVRKIGESPWFAVVEGPVSDFTGRARFYMTAIIIISLILIWGGVVFNVLVMNNLRKKERGLGEKMFAETQNLVVAAKENAATSQDQSAAVKEIVATMEDNNALAESISTKILDVSSVAGTTSGNVTEGVELLAQNVSQLQDILAANQTTIDGIKSLGDKIENIWDIVTLINSVADQAKIIAFNAELEASSAGEAGKNFHIVATEIRRLADGIIDGTKEIKEKINEIQQSSDSLILASENGTAKINAGYENAKGLESKFESIKNASEITAGSASDITTIIKQQAAASEQILATLRQIAGGIENFTTATENISSASQNLRTIAEELNDQTQSLEEA